MKLQLLYFAQLREAVGIQAEAIEVPPAVTTVAHLRGHLAQRGGVWAQALAPHRPIRAAINQRMVDDSAALVEGAEVALFPPVTGG